MRALDGDAWGEMVRGDEGPDKYYLHIHGSRLEMSRAGFEAVRPGGPYRAYYLPASAKAVAVEVLAAWRAMPAVPDKKGWRLPMSVEF